MTGADRVHTESGFSLVEIIVSMFLLALLAMSFLPLVAQTLETSAGNTTLATATRLVSERMEAVRIDPTDCPTNSVVPATPMDPRGVSLEVQTYVTGDCPGLFGYRVTVAKASAPTKLLAEATTLISVPAP